MIKNKTYKRSSLFCENTLACFFFVFFKSRVYWQLQYVLMVVSQWTPQGCAVLCDCHFCLLPNTWKIQQIAKTAKIFFCFFFWQRTAEGFILFFPYVFLFRLTTLPVACIFFHQKHEVPLMLLIFFSMLQLFTLTLNGLVMCMRGRTNTWWQAGIKPLVNSRWKAKWPVWSKSVRISPSQPFIVSGTFSWHFYRYEKQFEGLGTSALACSTLT